MITGTRNFIGVEFNKTLDNGAFDMTIRPQMRLGIADNLLIGIVVGIPVSRENERFSSFLRLIWEPKHKNK
jgi:nucleoside recognition membrane protein YjiH